MLEAKNVCYLYERNSSPVLKDINVHIRPGEVVGLSGPSGRGKTTLCRLISGHLPAHGGEVRLAGKPLPAKGACPVQLLPQHPELAVNPRWKISRIISESGPVKHDLLERLHIKDSWMDRYPHELSGGELQRVCVARSLAPFTQYIIADETTSMLDAMTQARIWGTLLDEAKTGKIGVLVVSHDQGLLEKVCNRTLSLFTD